MNAMTGDAEVTLEAEEQARANVYALLSRLFVAPAGADLLRAIASGDESGGEPGADDAGEFAVGWRDLIKTAGDTQEAAVADEYHDLFVGTGRPEVSLYVGAYTARSSVDTMLVGLRRFLAEHGLERRSGVNEPEDHIAMLFEIMRFLIHVQPSTVDEQKRFFDQFLWTGGVSLCDAISEHPRARFFRSVARFAKCFLFVEHEAFAM
ncbi:MAG: molecular chaperone TorD family protein [Betaproteobacteria bacterium]|nr:MAG: molecular chaperone TorD family protein [Betaproteobacteria bacterium]